MYRLHTVLKDETWQEVSRRYGVSVTVIARINDLDPKYRLVPGQAVLIPPVSPPEKRRPQPRPAAGSKASTQR
jgi:LysM repeat protein